MKRICGIILIAFFLSVGAFVQDAWAAAKLRIINQNGNTIHVAVHYLDTENGEWRTRGWYLVQPNSTRDINFVGVGSEIYLHAYMGNIKWGNGDASQYVIGEAFDYYGEAENNCPDGRNRRLAKFSYHEVKNGWVNYKPTASN